MWKTQRRLPRTFGVVALVVTILGCGAGSASEERSRVEDEVDQLSVQRDPVTHGSMDVFPERKQSEGYPAGTELTLTARPRDGYVLDSLYHTEQGVFGPVYIESMKPRTSFVVSQDMRIGAAFIPKQAVDGFDVIQDVEYAQPGAKALKYDVYRPANAKALPLVVIIHGGGWQINDENIMRGMAREMVRTGRYVVVSIDYRWLGDLDGEGENNRLTDLIEDVFGALAHIQEYAGEYGADPSRIAITGDSAGGHLSAVAATMTDRIGEGSRDFRPTYVPAGRSPDDVRRELLPAIKVVAPSYGVFGGKLLASVATRGEVLRDVAPIDAIPSAKDRRIPHYLVRGSLDPLITKASVAAYADALRAAGQTVRVVEVEGAGHAFFDWKPDDETRRIFREYGVPAVADMLVFFDQYL